MYETHIIPERAKDVSEEFSSAGLKRVNFLLSNGAHQELARLSKHCNQTMTGLIRLGLSLVRLAVEAGIRGERIVIVGPDGTIRREIVLPMT